MNEIQTKMLAFGHLCLSDALERAVLELAKQHDNKPGKWLDDLEQACGEAALASTVEGVSPQDQIKIIEGGAGFLKFAFINIRDSLAKS